MDISARETDVWPILTCGAIFHVPTIPRGLIFHSSLIILVLVPSAKFLFILIIFDLYIPSPLYLGFWPSQIIDGRPYTAWNVYAAQCQLLIIARFDGQIIYYAPCTHSAETTIIVYFNLLSCIKEYQGTGRPN